MLGTDAMGNPLTMRTGPQFALDVGTNEKGDPEMRFVYAAEDLDSAGNIAGSYLQAGWCTTDLKTCHLPKEWRTAVSTGGPFDYFPALKFGVAPGSGAASWKLTWQHLNLPQSGLPQLALFSADLQRPDLLPQSATFSTTGSTPGLTVAQVGPFQTPCPDRRSDDITDAGYWGDYDGMAYNSTNGRFLRTFTDSSLGCDNRSLLTSHNVHVSELDLLALGAPRQALVTLSDIGYYTTGGNLFNCGGPAGGPNHQSICCEDSNGNFAIGCKPTVDSDGSFSTAEQHVSQKLSCGDGHGAWLDVYCHGTGIVGDATILGRVEMSVSDDCNKDDMPNDTGNDQVTSFSVGSDQEQDLGLGLACDSFSNACANDPCVFNQFSAGDVTVANTGL